MSVSEYSTSKLCPKSAHRQSSKRPPTLEVILGAFNTWAYKREQPSNIKLLTATVAHALAERHPIQFVLYWGKGPRSEMAAPDAQCLAYLASFAARIQSVYAPGAELTLIYTDTHAALNGHPVSAARRYFDEIATAASVHGFKDCRLGDLVQRHRGNVALCENLQRSAAVLSNLTRSAARWYRGDGDARSGAAAYYDMNMVERQVIELEFPLSIFITFNGSDLQELFPDRLPVFYMYSLRKGFGVKPWFLDASGAEPPVLGATRSASDASPGHAVA